jgi:hypothetical protein
MPRRGAWKLPFCRSFAEAPSTSPFRHRNELGCLFASTTGTPRGVGRCPREGHRRSLVRALDEPKEARFSRDFAEVQSTPSVRTTESSSRWCFRPLPQGAFVSYGFSEEFRPNRTPCSTLESSWQRRAQPASGNSPIRNSRMRHSAALWRRAWAARSSSERSSTLGFTTSIVQEIGQIHAPDRVYEPYVARRLC